MKIPAHHFDGTHHLYDVNNLVIDHTKNNVGIGVASPTGRLHLAAGTVSANTAPLKFTTGDLMTSVEAGAFEFDGSRIYMTPSTSRRTIAWVEDGSGSWVSPVEDKDLTAPPGSPTLDDRYIVSSVASGAWATKEDNIAQYNGATWEFTAPTEGIRTYVKDEDLVYSYNGSSWLIVETLNSLFDTNFTSLADNEVITYDSGSSKWLNETLVEAGIVGGSGTENYVPIWDATGAVLVDSIQQQSGAQMHVDGQFSASYGTSGVPAHTAAARFELQTDDVAGTRYGLHALATETSNTTSSSVLYGSYSQADVTGTTTALTTLYAARSRAELNNATASATTIYGMNASAYATAGTVNSLYGGLFLTQADSYIGSTLTRGIAVLGRSSNNFDGGTITNAVGIQSELKNDHINAIMTDGSFFKIGTFSTNTGTITNLYGLYDPGEIAALGASGTVTNSWFIYSSSDVPSYLRGQLLVGDSDDTLIPTSNVRLQVYGDNPQASLVGTIFNTATAHVDNKARLNLSTYTSTTQRVAFSVDAGFSDITDASRESLIRWQTAVSGTFQTNFAMQGENVLWSPGSSTFTEGRYFEISKNWSVDEVDATRYGLYVNAVESFGSPTGVNTIYGALLKAEVSSASNDHGGIIGSYSLATINMGVSSSVGTTSYGSIGAVDWQQGNTLGTIYGQAGLVYLNAEESNIGGSIGSLGFIQDLTTGTRPAIVGTSSWLLNSSTSTWTDAYFFHVHPGSTNTSGTITNLYGIYDAGIVEGMGAATSYFIYSSSDVPSYLEGKVGIGTSTIPHGGIGTAKVAIDGPNNSANGPHVQFTTDTDNYPLLQVLNFAHDNIKIGFDAYFESPNWVSSDTGSSFRVAKTGDLFKLQYDNATAGTNVTWNDGWYLDTSGVFTFFGNMVGSGGFNMGTATDTDLSVFADNQLLINGQYWTAAVETADVTTTSSRTFDGNTSCLVQTTVTTGASITLTLNYSNLQPGGRYMWLFYFTDALGGTNVTLATGVGTIVTDWYWPDNTPPNMTTTTQNGYFLLGFAVSFDNHVVVTECRNLITA